MTYSKSFCNTNPFGQFDGKQVTEANYTAKLKHNALQEKRV